MKTKLTLLLSILFTLNAFSTARALTMGEAREMCQPGSWFLNSDACWGKVFNPADYPQENENFDPLNLCLGGSGRGKCQTIGQMQFYLNQRYAPRPGINFPTPFHVTNFNPYSGYNKGFVMGQSPFPPVGGLILNQRNTSYGQ